MCLSNTIKSSNLSENPERIIFPFEKEMMFFKYSTFY
jgi:hypothetical protein